MDYIRISQQVVKSPSRQELVAEPEFNGQSSTVKVQDVKELLKDWIKLYPNSFAPDVEFKIYQLADGDIIIELHEDLSSMAVALLVLYIESIRQQDNKTISHQDSVAESVEMPISKVQQSEFNSQQPIAYITIDDTEVLLKQNEGKRAMVFVSQQVTESPSQQVDSVAEPVEVPTANSQSSPLVRFLLEDNYCLEYNFEKRAKPVKDSGLVFNEEEITLPEVYESLRVGDVVKKKIDAVLEEGLTPKKLLIYFLCGAIGLGIGFLIVYLMSR